MTPEQYGDAAREMFVELANVRTTATWRVRQKNVADRRTSFIYGCRRLADVRAEAARVRLSDEELDYAEHRWRNYWRHDAWLYLLLAIIPGARPFEDDRDRTRDLYLPYRGTEFTTDLKVTRIPRGCTPRTNDEDLAVNYYGKQSQQQRHHLESRFFVVGHPELDLYDYETAVATVRSLDVEALMFQAPLGSEKPLTAIVRHGRGW